MHLSSILAKLAEIIIGKRLVSFLQRNAFAKNQWKELNWLRRERSGHYVDDVLDSCVLLCQENDDSSQ